MARSRVRKPLTDQQKAERIAEKHKAAHDLLREICTDHIFEEADVDDDFDAFLGVVCDKFVSCDQVLECDRLVSRDHIVDCPPGGACQAHEGL